MFQIVATGAGISQQRPHGGSFGQQHRAAAQEINAQYPAGKILQAENIQRGRGCQQGDSISGQNPSEIVLRIQRPSGVIQTESPQQKHRPKGVYQSRDQYMAADSCHVRYVVSVLADNVQPQPRGEQVTQQDDSSIRKRIQPIQQALISFDHSYPSQTAYCFVMTAFLERLFQKSGISSLRFSL